MTLGVPRLREIIMTASKVISTPMMEVVMNDPTDKECMYLFVYYSCSKSLTLFLAAEAFANKLQPIKLSELVESIATEESIDKVCFSLFPPCTIFKIVTPILGDSLT